MPYTVRLIPIDVGSFYGTGYPTFSGTISSVSPPFTPPERVLSFPVAPTTLPFLSPSSPPTGTSTLLVLDTFAPGDLFRSGPLTSFPPSPGLLTVFTVPTIPLPFTLIGTLAAGVAPFAVPIPTGIAIAAAILSGGTFIPLTLTVMAAIAPKSLNITVTGLLLSRAFYLGTPTSTFTLNFSAVPAPSGDAFDRTRIVSIGAASPSLTVDASPSPSLLLLIAALAPVVANLVASRLEAVINSTIASLVAARLTAMGLSLSPTAVICARRVAALSSGVSLQLALSDLVGPAVIFPSTPGALQRFAVAIAPPPEAETQQVYTITVTDSVTGAPVSGASVTLENFSVQGRSLVKGPLMTDGNGQVTFDEALHPVTTPTMQLFFISPTLNVNGVGYFTLTLQLLAKPA